MDNPEWQHKKEKQNKNTTQYVLNTTIRKQTHKYHTYNISSPDIIFLICLFKCLKRSFNLKGRNNS